MASHADVDAGTGLATPASSSIQETDFGTAVISDQVKLPPSILHESGECGAPDSHRAHDAEPAPRPAHGSHEPLGSAEPPPARALAPDLLRGTLMAIMVLDHVAITLRIWDYGQGRKSELSGVPVHRWSEPQPYAIRTLTHLCAPGFTFLLGMGVEYWGCSRARLGWSARALLGHFAVRAAVLTLIAVVMGLVYSRGRLWLLNVVTLALAVDYLVAGVLWLALTRTEAAFARALAVPRPQQDRPEARPLLEREKDTPDGKDSAMASPIPWHFSNMILVVLIGITASWNIWLSPTGGHCQTTPAESKVPNALEPSWPVLNPENPLWDIWFKVVETEYIVSLFPPMAWLSFAIMGLLYGRIVRARSLSSAKLNQATLAAAFALAALFVATRLFRFGNLSEDCLLTPEHAARPGSNSYLTSAPAFFYLVKYPPDVAFISFTMSLNLFLLAIFGSLPLSVTKSFSLLLSYGTSALFFYVVHQSFVFSVGGQIVRLVGYKTSEMDPVLGRPMSKVESVWWFWALWAATLVVLHPLCAWYSGLKRTKGLDSIWRFF